MSQPSLFSSLQFELIPGRSEPSNIRASSPLYTIHNISTPKKVYNYHKILTILILINNYKTGRELKKITNNSNIIINQHLNQMLLLVTNECFHNMSS